MGRGGGFGLGFALHLAGDLQFQFEVAGAFAEGSPFGDQVVDCGVRFGFVAGHGASRGFPLVLIVHRPQPDVKPSLVERADL
jgi:hypothetical protein